MSHCLIQIFHWMHNLHLCGLVVMSMPF
jgi:hypothetical protein